MAKFAFKAGEEYAIKLSRMDYNSEEIAKKAIYGAVEIVANKIKSNLQGVLSSEATGDMTEAFGVTPIERDGQGNWNAKIGFDGYDHKGVPNQLKARAMESGTSTQPKKPFVRPALNATKKQAQARMAEIIDEEYKKMFGK